MSRASLLMQGKNLPPPLFMQAVEGVSYLQTSNASLDEITYNAVVSRVEAVHSIVRTLFHEALESADNSETDEIGIVALDSLMRLSDVHD